MARSFSPRLNKPDNQHTTSIKTVDAGLYATAKSARVLK
jgi:hypothetical protein